MILFNEEPMQFELAEVSEESHLRGGKIFLSDLSISANHPEYMLEIQIAMISILQERTLTIDQRLIVLGFFLDKLDEIISDGKGVGALTKLIAAYESKQFLSEQVPHMLEPVQFDAKKFIGRILELLEKIYGGFNLGGARKLMDALVETLKIFPDSNGEVSGTKIAANYERLADERKNFLARYSTFSENFLINEVLMTCLPWRHKGGIAKNFGVFVATYKIFELLMFAAVQKNLDRKGELLQLVSWFTNQADHNENFAKKFCHASPTTCFCCWKLFWRRLDD